MPSDNQAAPKEKEIVEDEYTPVERGIMGYCTGLFMLTALFSFCFAIFLLITGRIWLGIATLAIGFPQAVGFSLAFSFVSSQMEKCKTMRTVPVEETKKQKIETIQKKKATESFKEVPEKLPLSWN